MYESLTCEVCRYTWTRQLTRGRKPRVCPSCQYFGHKPAPRINREAVVFTDGGQRDAGIRDTNDCTVRAMATATNSPYDVAHTFMAENGRRKGKGAFFESILARNGYRALGYTFTRTATFYRSRGIKSAMARNPQLRTGTWILKMRTHVATLKDGKVYDSFDSSRKDVLWAWKVEPI